MGHYTSRLFQIFQAAVPHRIISSQLLVNHSKYKCVSLSRTAAGRAVKRDCCSESSTLLPLAQPPVERDSLYNSACSWQLILCSTRRQKERVEDTKHSSNDSDEDSSIDSSISDSDSDSSTNEANETSAVVDSEAVNANHDSEDEEEDEIVKAIRSEREKSSEHPPDIHSEDFVVDISFHPVSDVIAAATITGDVILYKYTNDSTEVLNTLELHTKACRDIEFSSDGSTLFSSSKDKSIMLSDADTGKLKHFYENAHEDPVYCLLVMNENLLASGDDGGTVKLWDIRQKDPVGSVKEMDDYVSSMVTTEALKYLVCSSGEGTITSIDIGTRKPHVQSEEYEAELTCLATMRRETKLVAGSSKGVLYFFDWGDFGYHSDEYPGIKESISCLLPVTENIAVFSGEDGVLRALHLFPQRQLGVVGNHKFAVESLDISGDGQYIASSSIDQTIKFWNIKYFEDLTIDCKKKAMKKEASHNLPSSKSTNASDFFSGLT